MSLINSPVIRVDHLSKMYKIGRRKRHDTLRDQLALSFKNIMRVGSRGGITPANSDDTIWAVKDVSFEVQPGEVVGIIGRNGAGKSTLLKLLSRITEPSSGFAEIKGRLGSLLEVGTGFHPELTGRENIFLNGAILGIKRSEIARKFDEIVAFAEIERFIDTPVKHYSSGMYVRLAFAVAASMETEVLVVDEVLAVGDADFQARCIGRLQSVGREGRTVLFVSHSMPMLLRLCTRGILIDQGSIKRDGPIHEVIRYYRGADAGFTTRREWNIASAPGNEIAKLLAVRVSNDTGLCGEEISIDSQINLEVEYLILDDNEDIAVQLGFFNSEGLCLFITQDINNPNWRNSRHGKGHLCSELHIPQHFFAEGQISVNLMIVTVEPTTVHVHEQDIVSFSIVDRTEGEGVRGKYAKEWPGLLRPMLDWSIKTV